MKTSQFRPRLAIDATRMEPERTGIENYLHNILPGVVRLWTEPSESGANPGEVVVFARGDGIVDHLTPRPEVVASGSRGWTQLALAPALRRADADVYFSPIPVLPVLGGMPCPAVVTVHDLDFQPWWYYRRLLRRTFSLASGIVCVSQATRERLAEEFPAAAEDAVVVHEGADPRLFHPDEGGAADLLRRFGLDQPPLLAVGTIQPRKNYARLLRAYALLPREAAPPLVIVGRRGWDFEAVLALRAELGIADRVVFTGHLDDFDVAGLLRASLLLCAVSTEEGFGLPLVEAMYTGVPILASDIPPFREVAGTAARFVNPLSVEDIAAGMQAMLADPAARTEMGRAGLRRRHLFDWEVAAQAIVAILRRSLINL